MSTLADYLKRTAQRRDLNRTVDGTLASYRLLLEGQASVNIVVDEVNPSFMARVTSEAWPVPVTSAAYLDFMQQALVFNRNALHHLPCGIVQDPSNASLYRLTWWVPGLDLPDEQWRQRLRLFGKLVEKAWSTMPVPGQSRTQRRAGDDFNHVIFMP
ncbi:hypothetical protein [Limnohabitans sp. 2KL-3]|jgi:hypothetical protein|uniref:hypothetical protein n=1 Tax=Limnohabitans sp. 2KL-3 TaxID=1100700 RepID=UPI000B1AF931|nr:hypothetical protein [Limnohabitans sp. 2KL-3]